MNHNGHLCVWMATTARSNSCRPLRALTSERNSCCFAGRCSWHLARNEVATRASRMANSPTNSVCVGGGRVARLFCQRGGALEGLVGPCEAGARTAAPAQTGGRKLNSTKRETAGNGEQYHALDSDVGAFLPPNCCDSSSRDWWFPGRNSPEFHQKVSKVKYIAPACCQQALNQTLLHKVL